MTTKLAARYINTLATMADRKERGATALEYIGMIIVAAIVVGAVIGVIEGLGISSIVSDNVNTILNR